VLKAEQSLYRVVLLVSCIFKMIGYMHTKQKLEKDQQ